MSANPFSDSYATFEYDSPGYVEHVGKDDRMTVTFPETIPVPYLNPLPSLRVPSSTFSDSSAPSSASSSTPPFAAVKIEWTNADLELLVSAFYPAQMFASELLFEPALPTLHNAATPLRLELCHRIAPKPIPSSAYAATAPIGTGRPTTKLIIAASAPSNSPALARRSLATTLLGDGVTLRYMVAHYELMAALFSLPAPALRSVHRGVVAMGNATEVEWRERFSQVVGAGVDASWGYEAHLEAFLLRAGYWELARWEYAAEIAIGLGDEEREERAGWLNTTWRFLESVLEQL